MSQPEQLQHGERRNEQPPSSQLDIYDRIIQSGVADDYLKQLNLGLGNYSTDEYWQQVQSYQKGSYAEAAFARLIIERAEQETKAALGLQEWEKLSEEQQRRTDKRRFVEQRAEEIWEQTPEASEECVDKLNLIEEHAGISSAWTPPMHRMMEMRHEASRSREARLMDNAFGRVDEQRIEGESVPQGALTGGNGR